MSVVLSLLQTFVIVKRVLEDTIVSSIVDMKRVQLDDGDDQPSGLDPRLCVYYVCVSGHIITLSS